MTKLGPPDTHHIRAAQGWFELGNVVEAAVELNKVRPKFQNESSVLEMRWAIEAAAKNWEACIEIAQTMVKSETNEVAGWLHRSYALHELKRTKEALDLLTPAVGHFPKVSAIRYNLACYACQLGDQKEAWNWLKQAIELGNEKEIKLTALDDPDLEPLWVDIGDI